MDINALLCDRPRQIETSGIRKVFELGTTLPDPINLSIGQPDFPVPDPIKRAAIEAIEQDRNGYTLTQGIAELRKRIEEDLAFDVGWSFGSDSDTRVMVTSGTSGALLQAFLALMGPDDEIIIPDPYFVMYPHLATICGGKAVLCDTYPDFHMTAARVEKLITEHTKAVLFNSPGNPTGIVASKEQCADLLELCKARNILLITDEIYDRFTYADGMLDHAVGDAATPRCPSPARCEHAAEHVLLVRGFGKTYGVTGWRMGYCAGPRPLVDQLAKFQQYTFVCPPSIAQWGCLAAFDTDMSKQVSDYQHRRDLVVEKLSKVTELAHPAGAFYAFVKIPEKLGLTGTAFTQEAVKRNVLVIPGGVFSSRDTHIRLSFATDPDKLVLGLDVLAAMMK